MLTDSLGKVLTHASHSSRLRRAVESFPPTRRVVDRFVPGETVADAVQAASRLVEAGRLVTLDVLGEDVRDLAGAVAVRDGYLDLLRALDLAGLADGADVSVKLSALGQALPDGPTLSVDLASGICDVAGAVGATVTLDMEDHTTVEATLAAGEQLRASYHWVGNVLQANLRRTPGDLADLAATTARIRLVKGAYREPEGVALPRKGDVDRAYGEAIDVAMRGTCRPLVATHDPLMLDRARAAAAATGRTADAWEAQMLYGVRPELEQTMIDAGVAMRVYVPFGVDWYGYFMRRLAERPANVGFFLRALAHR